MRKIRIFLVLVFSMIVISGCSCTSSMCTKGDLNAIEESISKKWNENTEYKYVYVLVDTGNDYENILEYNISTQQSEEKEPEHSNSKDQGSETGLFDYDFGELILLVLVVLLIVSCALIITQKIVDYKKRLY